MVATGRPIAVETIIPASIQIATGTADATGAVALAANPYRRWGVWIQNIDQATTDNLLVGTVTGDCVILLAAPGNAVNTTSDIFIPGTGPIFLKASGGTLTTYVLFHV